MPDPTNKHIELTNRLKRGTLDGKLIWERTGTYGDRFQAGLEKGFTALVARTPNGEAALLQLKNSKGMQTLSLDSSRTESDLLRLALLQLFVAVRDSLELHKADDALDAVEGL